MTTVPVALTEAPVDIGAALSVAVFTGDGSFGRGAIRLFNSLGNASLYVLVQEAMPDETAPPPVRVRPGEWFPEELAVSPAAVPPADDAGDRIWAWSTRAGTATAFVVRWSW